MRRPRLAMLDASHGDENVPRNFRRELPASLAEFDVTAGERPPGYEFDGVVITGSRSSVYWEEEWIDETKAWVDGAIEAGLPCLGVCWGHQLLATVLGGRVADMGVYEIGYHEIERTTDDSVLLDGVDETFVAFTTHTDAVVELPADAVELARNEYSNHAFRAGDVFGVQFHPEYDAKSARDLTMEKDLSPDRREAVLDGITDEAVRLAAEPKRLFENFAAYVERVSPATEGASARATSGPESPE
ncbi:type 1 glutamine amidotransferase [Halovivax limisalsi]|uniref:type 1 glutamine amidotransferase n=1 Tax=Halovivax limisalsi TaxID=1453760 RepID=UPI001FFD44C1|nr:type 1 glutamine amidotransferase [Halovivax limisalsi]